MTWEDHALARQLLTEERVGTLIRDAKRQEDAIAKQTRTRGAR